MRWDSNVHARRVAAIGIVLLATALGTGCGSAQRASGDGENVARARSERLSTIDLDGARLRVGSKDFTEQLVLGHIASEALRAAGARPETDIGSAGTVASRDALLSGETDLYWEYTGTTWIEFLHHARPIRDASEQYDAVAREDRSRNGIEWLEPAKFDNTYAIAASPSALKRLDVRSISDMAQLLRSHPGDATICVESEFATRRDGLPGLEAHYDASFPTANVHRLDTGVIYGAVDRGSPCTFGEVFRTDARIASLDLDLLEDDEDFFPIYQPAVTVRTDVLMRYPEIADVFERVAPLLDEATMIELNRRVDIDGERPRDVATDWLRHVGLTG